MAPVLCADEGQTTALGEASPETSLKEVETEQTASLQDEIKDEQKSLTCNLKVIVLENDGESSPVATAVSAMQAARPRPAFARG